MYAVNPLLFFLFERIPNYITYENAAKHNMIWVSDTEMKTDSSDYQTFACTFHRLFNKKVVAFYAISDSRQYYTLYKKVRLD